VYLIIDYLDNDSDLANIYLMNKQCHKGTRDKVLKQVLLVSSPERLIEKRAGIWMSLLGIHAITLDYKSLRQRVYANLDLISNVEEVIQLDVQRTEHQMPGLDPQVLLDVLRTYALYNPEIEYC